MARENNNTTSGGFFKWVHSIKEKREGRKRDEAARNTRAAEKHQETLNMTGGTARPGTITSQCHSSCGECEENQVKRYIG
jgi:hypothetical protein